MPAWISCSALLCSALLCSALLCSACQTCLKCSDPWNWRSTACSLGIFCQHWLSSVNIGCLLTFYFICWHTVCWRLKLGIDSGHHKYSINALSQSHWMAFAWISHSSHHNWYIFLAGRRCCLWALLPSATVALIQSVELYPIVSVCARNTIVLSYIKSECSSVCSHSQPKNSYVCCVVSSCSDLCAFSSTISRSFHCLYCYCLQCRYQLQLRSKCRSHYVHAVWFGATWLNSVCCQRYATSAQSAGMSVHHGDCGPNPGHTTVLSLRPCSIKPGRCEL